MLHVKHNASDTRQSLKPNEGTLDGINIKIPEIFIL
jgi:hypothetical protein